MNPEYFTDCYICLSSWSVSALLFLFAVQWSPLIASRTYAVFQYYYSVAQNLIIIVDKIKNW